MPEDGNQFTPDTPTEDLVGRSAQPQEFSVRLAVFLWDFIASMAEYLVSGVASFLLIEQMRGVEAKERPGRKQFFRGILTLILAIVLVVFLIRIGQDIRAGLAGWSAQSPLIVGALFVGMAGFGGYLLVFGYCEQETKPPSWLLQRRYHFLGALGIGTIIPATTSLLFEYEGQVANLLEAKATFPLAVGILLYATFLAAAVGTIVTSASVATGMSKGVVRRGANWVATSAMFLGGISLLWGWIMQTERVLDPISMGSGGEVVQLSLLVAGWCLTLGVSAALMTQVQNPVDH